MSPKLFSLRKAHGHYPVGTYFYGVSENNGETFTLYSSPMDYYTGRSLFTLPAADLKDED